MLGSRIRGGRMEGADESTELWRHPNSVHCTKNYLCYRTQFFHSEEEEEEEKKFGFFGIEDEN